MENNNLIKYDAGLIKRLNDALSVTNKLVDIDFRKINALHFDDHKIFLNGMTLQLKRFFPNLTMESFTNSELALHYYENSLKENIQIDLIITGLNQRPDIDGYEFAKTIREIEKPFYKRAIILIVSMYDNQCPLIVKGLEEKIFDKYFPKTVDAEIFDALKNLIK